MTKDEQTNMLITKYDLLYEQRITKVETTCQQLLDIVIEIKHDMREIRKDMKADFRWLLFVMGIMFAVMAHGFKWF
jgi:hypothetical protein